MEAPGGKRLLLTCAMTRYDHCAEWDREELRADVARMVGLFCGDFPPEAGRYTHAEVLGESPTSVELRDRLRDFFLSTDRHPDDYVAVYLTGHGEILDNGDFVVLTRDTRPSDLLNRTVPAGDIVKMALAGTRVRRLLLLLDTCYAGQGGEDMTREALRRIDEPGKRSDDQGETAEGGGVVLVAATRPYQQALPGAFTSCLDRAARSLAAAGNAPPTLRVGALIGAMRSDPERPESQASVWHQVGMTGDEPSFIVNPRYRPPLADAELLDQERARYAEQRADQLRDRFLPATRWFTGRHAALTDLGGWLGTPAGPGAAVVTGHAGSGKTALLGLLAALSDPDQAPGVPRGGLPPGLTVPDSVIAEAIYAGTMTTGQIRDQIAAAAGLHAETTAELIEGLSRRGAGALTVLIDALDEAADPPGLASGLLGPLIRERPGGLRLLLGTRPHLLTAKLLGAPDTGRYLLVDLDSAAYADPASIRGYIRRILLSEDPLDSAYRPSGLYRTVTAAVLGAVADAIGEAAGASFLVARITATTEATATRLPSPADPAWRQALPRHAGQAMRRDLELRLGQDAGKAAALLLPLAYAQGGGLPWEDIWPRLADALSPGRGYGNQDLIWLRRAAGSYAVEGLAFGLSAYRLYHRALAEYLLEGRDQRADQQAITSGLVSLVPPREGGARDWPAAHPYTCAHLATHAAQAERIDDLLTDPAYLLAAGRPQLLAAVGAARSAPARAAADAYHRAAHHLRTAPAEQHASYLQLAARCGRAPQLADALESHRPPGTWSSRWASWRLTTPHRTFTGPTGRVYAVAAAELNGRPVVISGGSDATVRVWDLATGAPVGAPFTGHHDSVHAVAVAQLDGRPVVVSGAEGEVQRWDLASGTLVGDPFTHHAPWKVRAIAVAELEGRPVVISADPVVYVWDLVSRAPVGRTFFANAKSPVAIAELDGRPVVISTGSDAIVRVWDMASRTPVGHPFTGHTGSVHALAAAQLDGRPVVISGSSDKTIQVWDLATGTPVGRPFTGHTGPVTALATAELDGRPVAISGSFDNMVRVWDLATGAPTGDPFRGHTDGVASVTAAMLDGRPVAISGSPDATIRVWDLASGTPARGDPFTGHTGSVHALAAAQLDGRPVVISGSSDKTIQVWDLATGAPVGRPFTGHTGSVHALAAAQLDGRPVVISGSFDYTIRVWDLATGAPVGDPVTSWGHSVSAVAVTVLDGRLVVISGSYERMVRVWDLASGAPVGEPFWGHTGPVTAVAVTLLDGRQVVISGSDDATVRVWDLASGEPVGRPFTGQTGWVSAGVATAELDGRPVAISASGKTVQVWDLASGAPTGDPFTGHGGGVTAVAAAELDGRPVVISGSGDATVRVSDLATGTPVGRPFTGHTSRVTAVATAELDGRPVAISGGDDATVRVSDLATGAPVGDPFTGHTGVVSAVDVNELDGRPVAISGGTDAVRVWDLATGTPVGRPFTGHTSTVNAVATAVLDGRPVAVSAGYDALWVWDLATGTPVGDPSSGAWVLALAVAVLDGRPVAVSAGGDSRVRMWDLSTSAPVGRAFRGHRGNVYAVATGELDGRPVAISAGYDTVRVWDLARRRAVRHRLRRVCLHSAAPVLAAVLAYRQDRVIVITGCQDSVSQAWDLSVRRVLSETTIPGHSGVSAAAILSPDHVLYANGTMMSLYEATNAAAPILTIELDSEIHALATRGTSTVVAATSLGLVALEIPH